VDNCSIISGFAFSNERDWGLGHLEGKWRFQKFRSKCRQARMFTGWGGEAMEKEGEGDATADVPALGTACKSNGRWEGERMSCT
jgi:hypothetical protein